MAQMVNPAVKETTLTFTSSNKLKGLAYAELLMVIVILAMLSAGVAPRAVSFREGAVEREFVSRMERLGKEARDRAISLHHRVELSYDAQGKQLVLAGVDDTQDFAPRTNAAANVDAEDLSNMNLGKVSIPSSAVPTTFRLAATESTGEDWKATFYPDGTADSASAAFQLGLGLRVLVINPNGQVHIEQDEPDQAGERWQAGTYEARQQ